MQLLLIGLHQGGGQVRGALAQSVIVKARMSTYVSERRAGCLANDVKAVGGSHNVIIRRGMKQRRAGDHTEKK